MRKLRCAIVVRLPTGLDLALAVGFRGVSGPGHNHDAALPVVVDGATAENWEDVLNFMAKDVPLFG